MPSNYQAKNRKLDVYIENIINSFVLTKDTLFFSIQEFQLVKHIKNRTKKIIFDLISTQFGHEYFLPATKIENKDFIALIIFFLLKIEHASYYVSL